MSSPRYDWWGYVKAIIRRYPRMKDDDVSGNALKEKEAVRASIEQTEELANGAERIEFISMVFWKQHTHLPEQLWQFRVARGQQEDGIQTLSRPLRRITDYLIESWP